MPPLQLSRFVSTVLNVLSTFFEICGGNFTIWPLFIAAVESYKTAQQEKFLTLLSNVGMAGMRDISNYRILIKRIWNVRESMALVEGREVADTRVDWRKVMRDFEMDLLIV